MNKIPNHILVEVFSYFECSTLQTLMKVCKNWSNLIKTSRKLIKKFELTVDIYREYMKIKDPFDCLIKHSNLVVINRKYFTVANPEHASLIASVVKHHKNSLQKVNFLRCNFMTKEILNLFCEFIKEVEITDTHSSYDKKSKKKLNWTNLKSLRLHNAPSNFLLYFEHSQLSKLEYSFIRHYRDVDNIHSKLEKFFKNQKELKELKISKVEIEFDSFVKVLRNSNLSKLELDIEFISKNPDAIIELSKECHWKKIMFKNEARSEKEFLTVKNIIAAHPCIDELEFHAASYDEKELIIPFIHTHLPRIKHLRLPLNYGSINFNDSINFGELDVLEVEGIKYSISVQKFLKFLELCRNLKVLRIFWVGQHAGISNEFFKKIFEIVENLEELHIGYKTDTFELSDELLKTIKNEGKSLKKLTTYSDNVDKLREKMRIFNENGVKCVALDRQFERTDRQKTSKRMSYISGEVKTAVACVWSS